MRLSSTRRRRCDALGQRFKTLPKNHSLVSPVGVTCTPTARAPINPEGCGQSRRTNTLRQPNPDGSLVDDESPKNAQTGDNCSEPSPESLASHPSPVHLPSSPGGGKKFLFKRISRRAAANFSCHSLLYTIPPLNIEHHQPLTVQTRGQTTEQGTERLSPDCAGNQSLHIQAVADRRCAETCATGVEGSDVTKQTDLPGKYAYAVTKSSLAYVPDEEGASPEQQPLSHASRLQSTPKHSAEDVQTKPSTKEALCGSQQRTLTHHQLCNTSVLNITTLRYSRDTGIRKPKSVLAAPAGIEANSCIHVGCGWQRAGAAGDRSSLQVMGDSVTLVGAPAITASLLHQVPGRALRCLGGKFSAEVKPAACQLSDSLGRWTGIGSDYPLWQRQSNSELLGGGVLHPHKDKSAEEAILQAAECSHVDAKQLSPHGLNCSVPIRDFRLSDVTDRRPRLAANRCAVAPDAEEKYEEPDVTSAFRLTIKGGVRHSLICWRGKRFCGLGENHTFVTEKENISLLRAETKEALDSSSQIVSAEGVESSPSTDVAATDGYRRVTLPYGCGQAKSICRRAEEPSVSNTKRRRMARDRRPKGTNAETVASNFEEAISAMRSVLTLELCKFRDLIIQRGISHRGLEHIGRWSQKSASSEGLPLCCAMVDEKFFFNASGERKVKSGKTSEAAVAGRKLLSNVTRQNYAVVKISYMEVMSWAAGSIVTGDLLQLRTCGEGTVEFNVCERAEPSKHVGNVTQVRLIIPECLQEQLKLTALQHWLSSPEKEKSKYVTCYYPPAYHQQSIFLLLSKPRILRFQRRGYSERGNGEVDTISKEVPLLLHSGIAAVDG